MENKIDSALNLARTTNTPIARLLEKGIKRLGRPIKEIESAVENTGKLEIYKLEKNLAYLGIIAGIAPMLGFVGTISGVIKIFYNISLADNISIGLIAGGLYEKMVTSAAGLVVGIIAHIAFHFLNTMIDRVSFQLESTAVDFIDLLHEPSK
jgi:biopolymer transport protein ExbB